MGLLDNMAIRRVGKNLRPFMRADERLVEYDICDIDPVGKKVPVVLSSRAIYLMAQGRTAVRVPYANVIDLRSQGTQMLSVVTSSGNSFVLSVIGAPKGDLYDTIAHHLDQLSRYVDTVNVPGGDVHVRCRPVKEDGDPTWLYRPSDGVDLDDRHVQATLTKTLTPVAEGLGVHPPRFAPSAL